jgi:CDP-diacylglycerol--serine O-phosphatidyltransferase
VKKIAVVPTLLTLGNGICGFVAITYASKIHVHDSIPPAFIDHCFGMAGWFILIAMVFDMLDGYVARLSKTASAFGGELDSLCDVVSFGVTPAFLLLKMGPGWDAPFLHQLLAGIAALYFACTALRLARFNVDNSPDSSSHKRFKGLPSPGAAGCMAALAILRGSDFPKKIAWMTGMDPVAAHDALARAVELASPVIALLVALLMVSNVPYPHLTSKVFQGRRRIGHLVQVLLAGFLLVMLNELAPLLVFWAYAFLFPLRALWVRGMRVEPAATQVEETPPH